MQCSLARCLRSRFTGGGRREADHDLQHYLRGDASIRWGTIGLSVMATQASAVTFLSTPGQAYEHGMGFLQNYFGLPFALIVVCAVFIPIYHRLKVVTAYEYLGQRFDQKTRLLGAFLFLLQRGLAAGITIYAPAIILSALLGWNLRLTIILAGLFVIVYTATGGTTAVSHTQKWQMLVILARNGCGLRDDPAPVAARISLFSKRSRWRGKWENSMRSISPLTGRSAIPFGRVC